MVTGKVNSSDKSILLAAWNAYEGSTKYDVKFDYLEDGLVNGSDKSIMLTSWNRVKTIEEIEI